MDTGQLIDAALLHNTKRFLSELRIFVQCWVCCHIIQFFSYMMLVKKIKSSFEIPKTLLVSWQKKFQVKINSKNFLRVYCSIFSLLMKGGVVGLCMRSVATIHLVSYTFTHGLCHIEVYRIETMSLELFMFYAPDCVINKVYSNGLVWNWY